MRWTSSSSSASGSGDTALLRLLQDPDDPYLHSIQKLDLHEIVETMKRGPTAAVVAAQLRRPKVLKETAPCVFPAPSFSADATLAENENENESREKDKVEEKGTTTTATTGSSTNASSSFAAFPPTSSSAGAAVLEGLRVHGMARQHQVLVEEAEKAEQRRQAMEAAEEQISAEERAAAAAAAAVQHTWEGLCAVNAALRMLLEALIGDYAESEESARSLREVLPSKQEVLDAAYDAFCFAYAHYNHNNNNNETTTTTTTATLEETSSSSSPPPSFVISPERWQEDFVVELKDLREMFQAAGDPREIALE